MTYWKNYKYLLFASKSKNLQEELEKLRRFSKTLKQKTANRKPKAKVFVKIINIGHITDPGESIFVDLGGHSVTKEKEPKNNDGRQLCYWCGEPTKRVQSIMSTYDVCTACGK